MTLVALKGLLGRKLRAVLTAVAIVLGVAMISGTYVLTDTIKAAFGTVFGTVYAKTDAVISAKSAIGGNNNQAGALPSFPESLLTKVQALPGVGRKTANVVLGNAFGKNVGVVVDTHVARLSARLGLTRQTDPKKIERVLMKLIPQRHWTLFSHWLIFHGRRRCKAINPDCPHCEIKQLCPSYSKFMKMREKRKA